MYVASDSCNDLPVFPLLERPPAWYAFLSPFLFHHESVSSGIPDWKAPSGFCTRRLPCLWILQTGRYHTVYRLNPGHTGHFTYKDDFTIDDDRSVWATMHKDKTAKHRANTSAQIKPETGVLDILFTGKIPNILPMTIQGYLTYRQGTLKHGKRNMTEGLLWNAPTSARKRTIN